MGGLGFRLRPEFRLSGAAQYKRVLTQGARKKSAKAIFDLKLIANGVGGARLGYIVPKRLTPAAVQRNHIKRQIREIFRQVRADLPAVDLVVRQITAVKLMRRTQILHELSTLFSSITNA
ncbi:MAG: ribonuclease P protein component [Betaproteobacteria bacterium]|nr:ribonuclease P protein component [Betaproteobacteria bacterium]